MKIIMSKHYIDMAKSYDIPTDKVKTYYGVMEVSDIQPHELIIDINDSWLTDMIIAYAETVKTLVGMIEGAKFVLESLELKAEKITRRYYKSVSDTDNRKAA